MAQVAAREIETTEKIADAIIEIINDLGRWDKYVELFSKSDRVRNTAAQLFSQIIRFLIRAKSHYQSHRASKTLLYYARWHSADLSKFDTSRLASRHMLISLKKTCE